MLGQQEWIAIQNAPVQAQASFAVNTIYSSDKMSSEVYLCKNTFPYPQDQGQKSIFTVPAV